ncbi:hypothetical protein FACS1894102_3930 [Spirochaetia bacterium]|nr:hypothetical protein FACS1894102_3930 [Spirochaetia bacterium]
MVDKNLAQPYGDPINNPNKYTVYQGYLTTEFNFEADHEYIAQVIIDQDDDFLLYIWDSNQYPYRNNSNSITSKSKTEKFFVSPNTPMKDSNSYNK